MTAAAGQGGFTLVENIVSLIIVGIVLAAIAAVLVFGNNMMAHQKAVTNAQTLASTIKTSVEGTLRNAKGTPVFSDGTITFTNDKKTNYLAKGDYALSIQDGYVHIAKTSGASSSASAGGDLIPKSTYIDGDTVTWEPDNGDSQGSTGGSNASQSSSGTTTNTTQIKLTVHSQTNEELATTIIDIPTSSSPSGGDS